MGQSRALTNEQEQKAIQLYQSGVDYRSLATRFGIGHTTIWRVLKKAGAKRSEDFSGRYRFWTQKEDDQLRKLWGKASDREIAKIIGRERSSVANRRQLLGLCKEVAEAPEPVKAKCSNAASQDFLDALFKHHRNRYTPSPASVEPFESAPRFFYPVNHSPMGSAAAACADLGAES